MIGIDELRELLGDAQISDDRLEELRDILCAFAATFIDDFVRERKEQVRRAQAREQSDAPSASQST